MKINLNHIPNCLSARIDTAPLRNAIAKLRQYGREQSVSKALARKLSRVLRGLVRDLVLSEAFNQRLWLKYNMLHDTEWRAEVTKDLGGGPALARWDARKAKAETETLAPRIAAYKPGAQSEIFSPDNSTPEAPKPRRVTTDASGLFRLAPVKHRVRPLTAPEQFARREAVQWRRSMRLDSTSKAKARNTQDFKPIPVTPKELRGETNVSRKELRFSQSIEDNYGLPKMRANMNAADIMRGILDFDYDAPAPCAQSP